MLTISRKKNLSSTLHLQLGHEIYTLRHCDSLHTLQSNIKNWLENKLYGKPPRPASYAYTTVMVNEWQPNEELRVYRKIYDREDVLCWIITK